MTYPNQFGPAIISDGTPPRHRLRIEDLGEVLGAEDQEIERMFSDDVDPAAREPAPVDDTEICPACDGSGFGVADTYCGFCDGCGGVPIAVADMGGENG